MADSIPSLWPEEFKLDVQTPLTILRVQAGLLSKLTRGILQGEVETEESQDRVQHRLVVVAPACDGYRHTLLVASHDKQLPYPARVMGGDAHNNAANSDDEMQIAVATGLHSAQTKAVLSSLIATSNEAKLAS